MLLRRSLFVLDIFVLFAVVVFLVFLPAERCAHFEAKETPPDSKCSIHPAHHPEFSFNQNLRTNDHLTSHKHHVSVCHLLQWSHYKFWDNMYLVLLPALICLLLVVYTACEICEFTVFVGQVRRILYPPSSTLSLFFVIHTEKLRIRTNWPFLHHVQLFGAEDSSIHVSVPTTWQYSIIMCILSAIFKIGRILIQHFFGDKKFSLDEDDTKRDSGGGAEEENLLNESRFSRLATD